MVYYMDEEIAGLLQLDEDIAIFISLKLAIKLEDFFIFCSVICYKRQRMNIYFILLIPKYYENETLENFLNA